MTGMRLTTSINMSVSSTISSFNMASKMSSSVSKPMSCECNIPVMVCMASQHDYLSSVRICVVDKEQMSFKRIIKHQVL